MELSVIETRLEDIFRNVTAADPSSGSTADEDMVLTTKENDV